MIGARLILEDGSYFEGELFGAAQTRGRRSAFTQRHGAAPDQGSSSMLKLRVYQLCVSHHIAELRAVLAQSAFSAS